MREAENTQHQARSGLIPNTLTHWYCKTNYPNIASSESGYTRRLLEEEKDRLRVQPNHIDRKYCNGEYEDT